MLDANFQAMQAGLFGPTATGQAMCLDLLLGRDSASSGATTPTLRLEQPQGSSFGWAIRPPLTVETSSNADDGATAKSKSKAKPKAKPKEAAKAVAAAEGGGDVVMQEPAPVGEGVVGGRRGAPLRDLVELTKQKLEAWVAAKADCEFANQLKAARACVHFVPVFQTFFAKWSNGFYFPDAFAAPCGGAHPHHQALAGGLGEEAGTLLCSARAGPYLEFGQPSRWNRKE
jgi:hypothetical protein